MLARAFRKRCIGILMLSRQGCATVYVACGSMLTMSRHGCATARKKTQRLALAAQSPTVLIKVV